MPHTRDSQITNLIVTTASLVIAGLLAWIGAEAVGMHDSLVKLTLVTANQSDSIAKIITRLESVPSRTELDSKLESARFNIDTDNKAAMKGTKGAELIRQDN